MYVAEAILHWREEPLYIPIYREEGGRNHPNFRADNDGTAKNQPGDSRIWSEEIP